MSCQASGGGKIALYAAFCVGLALVSLVPVAAPRAASVRAATLESVPTQATLVSATPAGPTLVNTSAQRFVDTDPPLLTPAAARGLAALHAGDLEEADAAFRRARATMPADPAGPYGLALVSWWRAFIATSVSGRSEEAMASCDRHLEETLAAAEAAARVSAAEAPPPGGARVTGATGAAARADFYRGRAYATRALLRALQRRWVGAVLDARRMHGAFSEALEKHPGLTDAALWLGLYDVFIDEAPTSVRALGVVLLLPGGDVERGMQRIEGAAAGGGPFAPEATLYLAGIRYWLQNDPAAAIAGLRELGSQHPDNGYLPAFRAFAYLEAYGDATTAVRELSHAIDLAGDGEPVLSWPARLLRARAAFLAGLIPEALTDLESLDSETPVLFADLPARALLFEAQIQAQVGNVAAAQRALDKVLDEERWRALHGAARSERLRPHEQRETEAYRANLLGRRLAANGTYEAARAALESTRRRYPNELQSRYYLAEIDLLEGRFAEAAEGFAAVARQAPTIPTWLAPWAWIKAGWSYDAQGQRALAEAAYRGAKRYSGRYDEGAVRAMERFLERPYVPPG